MVLVILKFPEHFSLYQYHCSTFTLLFSFQTLIDVNLHTQDTQEIEGNIIFLESSMSI